MADAAYQDPIETGREAAKANAGKAHEEPYTFTEAVEEGQKTAEVNFKADQENNKDWDANAHIPQNDTSDAAKKATAKSQLDPTGEDPISASEVNKSALNAGNDTGNKNGMSTQEQAKRSENPGQAEEEGKFSTAGEGVTADVHGDAVAKTGDASTSNKTQAGKKK